MNKGSLEEKFALIHEHCGPDFHCSRRSCAMTAPPKAPMNWTPRLAREDDIPALEELIPLSVRTLQAPYYSQGQMEAALGPVFAVDRHLIRDGTYFVVE